MEVLLDFGERRLIEEVLSEYCDGIGNDCAILKMDGKWTVITTDPVPLPAAKCIAGEGDPYYVGWLLVIINASDLAAAGAQGKAFLAAIEARGDMPMSDFKRLLEGIRDACKQEGLKYVGGNLKESENLHAVGMAV